MTDDIPLNVIFSLKADLSKTSPHTPYTLFFFWGGGVLKLILSLSRSLDPAFTSSGDFSLDIISSSLTLDSFHLLFSLIVDNDLVPPPPPNDSFKCPFSSGLSKKKTACRSCTWMPDQLKPSVKEDFCLIRLSFDSILQPFIASSPRGLNSFLLQS